ncbi:MAG: hypothetical protein R3B09_25970 [Nannocystaceae bacterium]
MNDPDVLVTSWRHFKDTGLPPCTLLTRSTPPDAPSSPTSASTLNCSVVAPPVGRGLSTLTKPIRTKPSRPGGRRGLRRGRTSTAASTPSATSAPERSWGALVRGSSLLGRRDLGSPGDRRGHALRGSRRVVRPGDHLPKVDYRPKDLEGPTPVLTSRPDPVASEVEPQMLADLHQQIAALTADHDAIAQQLQVEEAKRVKAEANLQLASGLVFTLTAALMIAAKQIVAARSSSDGERLADHLLTARSVRRHGADTEREEEIEALCRCNAALKDENEALRAAAAERAATLEEENARLVDELAATRAATAARIHPVTDPRAHEYAALAEDLRAARQQLAEERDARLAAEEEALRTDRLLVEKAAAFAAIEGAHASLHAEVATIQSEADVALAEARAQLAEERLSHEATREQSEALRRHLAEIEAASEAAEVADDDNHHALEEVDSDELPLAEEAPAPDQDDPPDDPIVQPAMPADIASLLTMLSTLDPEHASDYQRLVTSPDAPIIARMVFVLGTGLRHAARRDQSALMNRVENAERAAARARRDTAKHAAKGRKKKSRR